MINKTHFIEHLRFALAAQLETAKSAAKTAHDTATHEENIAENKYDTLGLEAAYLAQGQAQRVNECYQSIQQFEQSFKEVISDKVIVGALVCVEYETGAQAWFYIGPNAGGLIVEHKQYQVQVLTPHAPLGKALLNKQCDDEVTLSIAGKSQQLSIINLL